MSQHALRLMLDPVAGVKLAEYERGKRDAAREILKELHGYALHYPNDDEAVRKIIVDELWGFYTKMSAKYPQAAT